MNLNKSNRMLMELMVPMVFGSLALATIVLGIDSNYANAINQVRNDEYDENGTTIVVNGVCSLQNSDNVQIECRKMEFADIAGQVDDILQVSS